MCLVVKEGSSRGVLRVEESWGSGRFFFSRFMRKVYLTGIFWMVDGEVMLWDGYYGDGFDWKVLKRMLVFAILDLIYVVLVSYEYFRLNPPIDTFLSPSLL
jgi:hypothetical protein